jgi:NADPH-dependent 2,4-dienoyl-CoA reductase/sulfur reductase-like enzyme
MRVYSADDRRAETGQGLERPDAVAVEPGGDGLRRHPAAVDAPERIMNKTSPADGTGQPFTAQPARQHHSRNEASRASGRPRVVIVGAGFGGLEAARALAAVDVNVTLVDRRNYHLFQPLLYQVATAGLSPADIAWPIRHILRRQRNVDVLMARVDAIDPDERIVVAENNAIAYDYLILATGARRSYFGNDDWEAVAPGLKKIDDATDIRRRLLTAFERAEAATSEAERRRLLAFVVPGRGCSRPPRSGCPPSPGGRWSAWASRSARRRA